MAIGFMIAAVIALSLTVSLLSCAPIDLKKEDNFVATQTINKIFHPDMMSITDARCTRLTFPEPTEVQRAKFTVWSSARVENTGYGGEVTVAHYKCTADVYMRMKTLGWTVAPAWNMQPGQHYCQQITPASDQRLYQRTRATSVTSLPAYSPRRSSSYSNRPPSPPPSPKTRPRRRSLGAYP